MSPARFLGSTPLPASPRQGGRRKRESAIHCVPSPLAGEGQGGGGLPESGHLH